MKYRQKTDKANDSSHRNPANDDDNAPNDAVNMRINDISKTYREPCRSTIGDSLTKSLRSLRQLGVQKGVDNVLTFADLKMVTKKKKKLITDCYGSIHSKNVMAIIGPSGAGKTTLIRALTLECFASGTTMGSVTLNDQNMTEKLFRQNCYVVKQIVDLWPYLTCQETLLFAAKLFKITKDKTMLPQVINEIIEKMGLQSCSNIQCNALSSGQKRRLSLSVALLKKPNILFLDEPTTGLDSASATHCMEEIRNLAQREDLIVLCTIHQPSSKVFHQFDQVMIMSMGRQAFVGDVAGAEQYFKSIGHKVPENTNPADYYLDLVNSDFSSADEVVKILDEWKERRNIDNSNHTGDLNNTTTGSGLNDFLVLIHRHAKLMICDPFLYRGRLIGFILASSFFALLYFEARPFEQAQALNKVWAYAWVTGIPALMDAVVVYGINLEYRKIIAETKNGLVAPMIYIVAKSILSLPFVLLSTIGLTFAGWVILGSPGSSYGPVISIWALYILYHEYMAEAFAILFNDPIMGMLGYCFMYFANLLFSCMITSFDDMIWPFKSFYYITPVPYACRSVIYTVYSDATWDSCTDPTTSAVCTPSTDGKDVLDEVGRYFAVISSKSTFAWDAAALILMTVFWKIINILFFYIKARKVAHITYYKKRMNS